ncbi:MAG: hypothetical protein EOM03_15460 [Clostridia bacterium]|nr:hypothetical protein [Clostridia bacterium]
MSRFSHWGLVTLTLALGLVLSACGGETDVDPVPLTQDVVSGMSCADAKFVQATVEEATQAPEESGKHRGLSAWIPDDRTVVEVQADLDAQVTKACAPGGSETSGTPSPTVSPTTATTGTASPNATPSASADPTIVPTGYIGWDQVVSDPPEGLEEAVQAHAEELGWDWDDVLGWASQRSPQGNAWNAQVVLVFGQNDLSASAARTAAGVDNDKVPVVLVTACTEIVEAGCPDEGVEVVLAPLQENGAPTLNSVGAVVLGDELALIAGIAGDQGE